MLPLSLFPSISWMLAYASNPEILIAVGGYFQKQSHQNRYTISGANGLHNLVIPVKHTGAKQLFSEVQISRDENWARYHMKALKSAYANSPFYEFYDYKIEEILMGPYPLLCDLVLASTQSLIAAFQLPVAKVDQNAVGVFDHDLSLTPYPQVFDDRHGFRPKVSSLDLLFNLGPEAGDYLQQS